MDDLEKVGIPGRESLRDLLTKCEDSTGTIEEFQRDNGILLPSLRSMLPLLDIMDVRRIQFHSSMVDEMKKRLISQIAKMAESNDEDGLNQLLQNSFQVIRVPNLQPIVLEVLKKLKTVDDNYLNEISLDKDLYEKCDISLKRKIWMKNEILFVKEVEIVCIEYVKMKDQVWRQMDCSKNLFSVPPRQRRSNEFVSKIIEMIGNCDHLYTSFVGSVRKLFLLTKNVNYCTVRNEVIMALHDAEVASLRDWDEYFLFVWCLDACIRDQNFEEKRLREMSTFRDDGEWSIIELSVILGNPFAINCLAICALKTMNELINKETLPRDSRTLTAILQYMNLGLNAWRTLHTFETYECLDYNVLTKCCPALISLMVDAKIIQVNSKLEEDDSQSSNYNGSKNLDTDKLQELFASNTVSSCLAIHYTFQVAKSRDKRTAMIVIPTLVDCYKQWPFSDAIWNNFIACLTLMADDFSGEEFCCVVFDEFFAKLCNEITVAENLLKLLYNVYEHLPNHRLNQLMSKLSMVDFNESNAEFFLGLKLKICEFQK